MSHPGFLIVGVIFGGMSVAQYLAANGKLPLNEWPFVRSPNRVARLAWAGWAMFLGVICLVYAFWPT